MWDDLSNQIAEKFKIYSDRWVPYKLFITDVQVANFNPQTILAFLVAGG